MEGRMRGKSDLLVVSERDLGTKRGANKGIEL